MPLVAPFETSLGVENAKDALLLTVRKAGTVAYGECVASRSPHYGEETIASAKYIIKQYLAPLLFRENLEGPTHFLELSSWVKGNNMAVASVEMALWDLESKLEGRSLAKQLGGTKQEVAVGVSVGIERPPEKLFGTVGSYLHEGYRRVKVKIKPGYDLEPVKAIRARFPDVPLQVDANSAYQLSDTPILKQLDGFGLLLIEQPLDAADIIDHSKLQKQLRTPICLDESVRNPHDAEKAVEIDACRIINIKPGRVRGIQPAREIHDFCVARGIPVWCGGMLETGIGRAFNIALASLPGFSLPGDISASKRYFQRDIITKPFELTKDGTLPVPEGPGIGVEVNQHLLDACTVSMETVTEATLRKS